MTEKPYEPTVVNPYKGAPRPGYNVFDEPDEETSLVLMQDALDSFAPATSVADQIEFLKDGLGMADFPYAIPSGLKFRDGSLVDPTAIYREYLQDLLGTLATRDEQERLLSRFQADWPVPDGLVLKP